ncbi:transmembrane sensor [Erwinia toletana]|uniref:Transmembrane sensor n=1 Tax=Winslowiella toletana TaxID=92490 RepID=A0ABS4P591_9GAMM|nr:ferric citrate uptake sigma factor regulator FecR [Winslowiella toletana]MBP2167276.1 transmembrane sensor [Winslowiella toletana]
MSATPLSDHQRLALKMAAQWFATLCAGEVSPQQTQKWQLWYQQHEDHRWAWQRVESLQGQLHSMPGSFSYQTLEHARQHSAVSRRRVLKSLCLLLGVGGSWQLWQSPVGQGLRADSRTATGEIKSLRLSDGSQLALNTNSAADIRFSAQQRLIFLHQGEISITTAADAQPQPRPFLVQTAQGMLRALGTEFVVRESGDSTLLSVMQHAVEVRLQAQPETTIKVSAGQQLRFSASEAGPLLPLAAGSGSWTRGLLSVSDWRLSEVIEEISRYRHGHLSCDAAVADLRISGTFPLRDTDRILTLLAQTLPVKVQTITRYWVKVVAA